MNIKHLVAGLSMLFLIPTLFLSADRGGGRGDFGGGHGYNNSLGDHGYNYGRYDNPNYNYGGESFVGDPFYGEYINPYPPAGAQPGMSDDSDALYNSYLQSNQSQGYFK